MAIMIPDEIWAVSRTNNKKEDLSYMCAVERTKVGDVNSATSRNQRTGMSWAGKDSDGGKYYDNIPIKGIYIGDSVERWTTSNKLFRVADPRGFVVEVHTGNIATLLHHTTVINGVVQDECIWARENGAHVILPINSTPYTNAIKKIDSVQQALKLGDLAPGDRVTLFRGQEVICYEYEYLGSVKLRWHCTYEVYDQSHSYYYRHNGTPPNTTKQQCSADDDTWVGVFMRREMNYPTGYIYNYTTSKDEDKTQEYLITEFETNPKIASRVPGDPSVELTSDLLNQQQSYHHSSRWLYAPTRVNKKLPPKPNNIRNTSYTVEILRIKGVN